MANFTTSSLLSWRDACARKAILNQYKRQGETKKSIENIQREINTLANIQYRIDTIIPNYLERLLHVERTRSHHIVRLIDHDDFKVALHFIPSRYEIRGHLHPDLINIIYLQQGELSIEQRTLSNQENTFHCTIQENQSCAGLLKLRNIHHLKSNHSPCIFLSFRLTKKSPHIYTIKKIFSLLASSTALLFLPNVITQNSDAGEQVLLYSSHHMDIKQQTPNQNVIRANKLRTTSNDYRELYNAAQLYQQEAIKGNAEAQYWLGVMYHDGAGITEDSDEALRWIAMSSDQNYPPAQKLLNHLLTREEIPDC